MRVPFVAGNWKLHLGPADAARVAADLAERVRGAGDVTIAVFPTALSLTAVVEACRGSRVAVGVQEVESEAKGAFTGANSAAMCRAAGAEYALVGHSERRQLYGETSDRCNQRLKAVFAAGLLPIYCVGETLAERRAGRALEVVAAQLEEGLRGFERDQLASLTLAYEPVWAIGTGETASPAQAQEMHAAIRARLRDRVGDLAEQIRIQYGGSVKPANAAELMACPDVDGALVGGASLDPAELARIVLAAAPPAPRAEGSR